MRGQITVCLILGTFYAVGLTACGVPMGLPVGFVIGFFNLIPFMSHVVGLPLALVLSWVDDQSLRRAVGRGGDLRCSASSWRATSSRRASWARASACTR